jgi:DNA-binding transcriptional LysR family regulator
MELRDIEYFTVVAEHGHLGRAAEALGLSTPALSKSLRRLEKSMKAKLVSRTPKGVELTAEGGALLAHVRPLRLSLHDISREIANLSEGRSGHLRLGAAPNAAEYLLPAALSTLLREAPSATVSLTVADDAELLPIVRNGQLDLSVTSLPTPPYEGVIQERLYEDEFVVYASADHPLARLHRMQIADLAQERWAFPMLDGISHKWINRVLEDNDLPPPRVTLLGGPMQIRLQAIGSSHLLGVAPRRAVREAASRLHLTEIPIKGLMLIRQVGVGYRKDAYLSPVARRFIEILKTTAKETAKD